jgi:hypothetical protein
MKNFPRKIFLKMTYTLIKMKNFPRKIFLKMTYTPNKNEKFPQKNFTNNIIPHFWYGYGGVYKGGNGGGGT